MSAIEKALAATPNFSDKTIYRIEDALGKTFLGTEEKADKDRSSAHEDLGAYSAKAARVYIGEYICFRPAFNNPKNLYAYLIDIEWNDDEACLVFQEKKRHDEGRVQRGKVYLPPRSSFVHLVTIDEGTVRHIIVSPIDRDGAMKGLIQTLFNPAGTMYLPVSAPFILKKTNGKPFTVGVIDERKSEYKAHRDLLEQVFKDGYGKQISIA